MAVQRILHEDEFLAIFPIKTELTVAAPTAAGATYVEAQADSVTAAIVNIIAALVAAGVIEAV